MGEGRLWLTGEVEPQGWISVGQEALWRPRHGAGYRSGLIVIPRRQLQTLMGATVPSCHGHLRFEHVGAETIA